MVVRYNLKGDWGSFSIAGLLRTLSYENKAAGITDNTSGWGISFAGKHPIGARDEFKRIFSTGSGLGRYIGLNTSNGAVLNAAGNLKCH